MLALLAGVVMGPTATEAQEGAVRPDTVVALTSRGPELLFVPDRITLRQGLRVRLRYQNGGDLPHNLAIVRDEDDIDAIVTASYEAQATGFVPLEYEAAFVVFTGLLSPGQTAEVDFVVPPPGEYLYICLFPGHANMMLGTLRSIG